MMYLIHYMTLSEKENTTCNIVVLTDAVLEPAVEQLKKVHTLIKNE